MMKYVYNIGNVIEVKAEKNEGLNLASYKELTDKIDNINEQLNKKWQHNDAPLGFDDELDIDLENDVIVTTDGHFVWNKNIEDFIVDESQLIKNWKEILTERLQSYNAKISEITVTLNKLVGELKNSPYNLEAKVNTYIDCNGKVAWEVRIGNQTKEFALHDFKIGYGYIEEDNNLQYKIKYAILNKFTFELN